MKRDLLRVVLSCALLLTFISPRALAAQDGEVTAAEEVEARAFAAAYSDRLLETHDYAQVVSEMYADGFMARHLKGGARRAAESADGSEAKTFMLGSITSLRFKSSLAADADNENWPRLYAAAHAMMYYGLLAYLSKMENEGVDELDESAYEAFTRDKYPPEAVKILDANPALADFVVYKGRAAVVETPEDLRAVTLALEEAARLTRASLAARMPSSERIEEEMRVSKSLQAQVDVSLVEDVEAFGYPKGTRLLSVFSAVGYYLILVRDGEKLKVAWLAYPRC